MTRARKDPAGGTKPSFAERLRTHSSSLIAKILEYKLLGDIGTELLLRGQVLEVLRSDVDAFGHDMVLETGGIVRHIQLKTKVKGGKNAKITCHTDLTLKASGCIIWTTYDPDTYSAVEYACFGGRPGEKLPDIGSVVAKRSTHKGNGDRPLRQQHRNVGYGKFEKITDIADLVDWLFVRTGMPDRNVDPTIITEPGGNAMLISTGQVSVIPISINMTGQLALVSVVPGPGCVGDLVAIGGGEQRGTWCVIDLKTGTWQPGSEDLWDNPAVAEAMRAAATQLQAQMSDLPTEGSR